MIPMYVNFAFCCVSNRNCSNDIRLCTKLTNDNLKDLVLHCVDYKYKLKNIFECFERLRPVLDK